MAAVVLGVVFFISGVANATSLRSTLQATNVLAPTKTDTVLTTSPASSAVKGTLVTLTATVTPVAPGNVQFKDGPNNLKLPVTVGSDGKAEGTITQLAVGPHQLSAEFIPSNSAAFTTSMSQIPFTVTAPEPATTSSALTTSSTSPIVQGTPVTLIATVSPPEAAGTVQFQDGTTPLNNNPVPVTNGTVSATTILNAGQRQLTAVFTPAEPEKFKASKSPQLSLNVIESRQTVTSPAQASGQSLDGSTVLDDRGVTVLDLGGLTDGRGVTLLDGGTRSGSNGLTLLDLGGLTDGRGVTLLDGGTGSGSNGLTLLDLGGRSDRSGVTVLRDRSSGGLLSNLLHALL